MPLFVIRHHHEAATCPAGDPRHGPMLLKHLAGAKAAGVAVEGEAVVNGAHEFYIIARARDAETVSGFMQPFSQMGSLDVLPASTCEQVVSRGKC